MLGFMGLRIHDKVVLPVPRITAGSVKNLCLTVKYLYNFLMDRCIKICVILCGVRTKI